MLEIIRTEARGEHDQILHVEEADAGLRAFLAVHSTRLGPAAGGIRRATYASASDALADALRLSRAMTLKCALADLPAGGAKTVVMDRPGMDLARAYRAIGRAVESLDGRYLTGPDVGTGDAELAHVRGETRHVNAPSNDAGAATAAGVLAALRGTLRALDGDATFAGRACLVQGLGSVGMAVARELLAQGATVLATDVRPEALDAAQRLGARAVAPDAALSTPADVLLPCALGGVLDAERAARVPVRAVCGSANNPLADADASSVLRDRGVLYAPDFAANAGAVIEGVLVNRRGGSPGVRDDVRRRIARIEDTVYSMLEESHARGEPSDRVAERRALARLAAPPARAA